MLNNAILKFILLFTSVFKKFGVDANQLKIILSTKLKIDDRRPSVYSKMGNNPQKVSKNSGLLILLITAVMGIFLTIFLAIFDKPYLGHTVYFSAFMVMLAVTLISDFTSVLIDVRDNYIILPKPVNDITFTISRILHIAIHSSKMALSLSISAIIYEFFFTGILSGTVFLLEVIIATILSIFLVNIVYLLVLKLSSPERFKDFISYFQIFFSVAIFASYYTLPRLINKSVLEDVSIENIIGIGFLPPIWLAAMHELVVLNVYDTKTILFSLIGFLSPLIALYLIVKVFAPGFNKKLSAISGSGSNELAVESQQKETKKSFMSKIANFVAPNPIENAGFKITWLLTSRYRNFKVKVYPVFAYVPVYFVYFGLMKKGNQSLSSSWNTLQEGNMYILFGYLTGIIILTVLQHVSQTEKHKASWIYFSTPHNQPGRILGGMFKAIVTKFYLPYFFIISCFSVAVWGPKIINDLFLAMGVSIAYGLLSALFLVKGFPFSQPVNIKNSGKIFVSLLLMIVPTVIGLLHYWASKWELAIWITAMVFLSLAWVIYKFYIKETWEKLELAE